MRTLWVSAAAALLAVVAASCNCGGPSIADTLLAEGVSCERDEQCQTGLCEAVPGGEPLCRRTCVVGCNASEVCVPFAADRFGCAIDPAGLCRACTTDLDCPYPGDRCLSLGAERFCGRDCSFDGTCPTGFRCADGHTGAGDVPFQCQPQSGTCACTPASHGQSIPCSVSNSFGTCIGKQLCAGEVGYGDCSARMPAKEICNGLDDDCDFEIDEDQGELSCGVGECARTVAACLGGELQTCVPGEISPELCDGKDNDCDGEVDEDFDLAADLLHCGACNNACALPNAEPSCQAGKCVIAACKPGFYDVDGEPENGCE